MSPVQNQVLMLLAELQRKYGMAYLFISHDLAVIRAMAHRVMVMKDGRVVSGITEQVLSIRHPPNGCWQHRHSTLSWK